ncbi:MAG: M20/M25/M40 family metallo-hydrolase [Bifidobacteriaceae bacterium]|jgi:acetylornithine deacetylase/succinyl-diaminopimelate desuccinylase-like protein|nr:M20/M25/M40 family metallo-hydrolase [Bifidobacteriaceae bacterium]
MDYTQIEAKVNQSFDKLMSDLKEKVKIPSISNKNFDQNQLKQSAQWIKNKLNDIGVDSKILTASDSEGNQGAPAILASKIIDPALPTVLLYAHHDVQPVNLEEWITKPFEPTQKGERLFGRGAADDGAGLSIHIAALRLFGDNLPVNVKLFIEGEEEIGSPSFANFIKQNKAELKADVIVVADSQNWAIGTPSITTDLRGVCSLELNIATLDHPVHSGSFSGPVLDSLTAMCQWIAKLHDSKGNVKVPGLKAKPDPEFDYDETIFRKDSGLLDGVPVAGDGNITGKLWYKPSICTVGIDAVDVNTSSNTILPRCRARISARVAPGQLSSEAGQIIKDYLLQNVPFGAKAKVRVLETGNPFSNKIDLKSVKAAKEAFTKAWGSECNFIGIGGSIPFTSDLQEVFPQAEILITGVEDPDARAHSANESVHIGELKKAFLGECYMLKKIAEVF